MSVAIVTGSAGLVGATTVRRFAAERMQVVGIDNNMRARLFGPDASTEWSRKALIHDVRDYVHEDIDIRNEPAIDRLFARYRKNISVVVHAAAQPSHDWAARDPMVDFSINAVGTVNLLEACRRYAPDAVFIFVSTNKVYGALPNDLPLVEFEKRWEVHPSHRYAAHGVDESLGIDHTLHSLFGVSKASADLLVQEYGRYFGMRTACFRGGCLTGPGHSGAQLHGFLAYLVKCALMGERYTVFGYKGKQVRDNIHAADLVDAFWAFFCAPKPGAVYNIGGARHANCSMIEAIELAEDICGRPLTRTYRDESRIGDHIWWISDVRRFQSDYPHWRHRYDLRTTMEEIADELRERRRTVRRAVAAHKSISEGDVASASSDARYPSA